MTTISERQFSRLYKYKRQKIAKQFYIQKSRHFTKIKRFYITFLYTQSIGPVVSNHGNLGPCPRLWRGIGAVHRITAICQFKARCERPTSMA